MGSSESTFDGNTCLQYAGAYKTSKGASGHLSVEDSKVFFEARGRYAWRSELIWMSQSSEQTVFLVPDHPLKAQVGGQGMLFVHNKGSGHITEYAGGTGGPPVATWFVEKLARADLSSVGAFTEEESGKRRDSVHSVTADAAVHDLKSRVLEMRKEVEGAQATLKILQQQAGARESAIRNPPLKDLSRMSADQLQVELDEVTLHHGQLKEQIDILQIDSMRSTSRSFSVAKQVQGLLPSELLGTQSEYGLNWNRAWEKFPFDPLENREQVRDKIRYGTRDKVAHELGLRRFGDPAGNAVMYPPYSKDTVLFIDASAESKQGSAPAGGSNLLGRYDVVSVRARPDFDRDWSPIGTEKKHSFWVMHAAAINIGESIMAADFPDYSRNGSLDKESYVNSMGHVLLNVVKTCTLRKAEHLVFFPLGLGAFVRHLSLLDRTFSNELEMQELRRAVCRTFVQMLAKLEPTCQIHMCISFGEGEPKMNADAFLRAFSAASGDVKRRTTIWPNGDSLQVAYDLSSRNKHVVLVNGANRKLLGNHWFGKHAKRAIDENLHRRSWTLSALSYMLNNFGGAEESNSRHESDLSNSVRRLGGIVHTLDSRNL